MVVHEDIKGDKKNVGRCHGDLSNKPKSNFYHRCEAISGRDISRTKSFFPTAESGSVYLYPRPRDDLDGGEGRGALDGRGDSIAVGDGDVGGEGGDGRGGGRGGHDEHEEGGAAGALPSGGAKVPQVLAVRSHHG